MHLLELVHISTGELAEINNRMPVCEWSSSLFGQLFRRASVFDPAASCGPGPGSCGPFGPDLDPLVQLWSGREWWSGESSPLSAATKPTWRRRDGLRWVETQTTWYIKKFKRKKKKLLCFYLEDQSCALFFCFFFGLSQFPNPRVWLVLPLRIENLRFLTTVHPSFKCFLSFSHRSVMKYSPQPPDICGASYVVT